VLPVLLLGLVGFTVDGVLVLLAVGGAFVGIPIGLSTPPVFAVLLGGAFVRFRAGINPPVVPICLTSHISFSSRICLRYGIRFICYSYDILDCPSHHA